MELGVDMHIKGLSSLPFDSKLRLRTPLTLLGSSYLLVAARRRSGGGTMQRCLVGLRPCVKAGLRTQGAAYMYRNNTNAIKQLYRSLSVAAVAPERYGI